MNYIKNIFSKSPFSKYSKRVDPALVSLIKNKKVRYIPIIIIFRCNPDSLIEARVKRLGLKIKYIIPFIRCICGKFPTSNFDNLLNILEIEKIYFDGKAYLMENKLENKSNNIALAFNTKLSYLTGKGVTVGFIDSGIYPHPDFTMPKNRIVDFKDFISHYDSPYDDNGHGTACIGAGFGAAIDGRFKATAFDANIVCAKAFNSFGTGFFSDILASMQWLLSIRDKYIMKIIVLPFGTPCFSLSFDILTYAVEQLWKQDMFVIVSSGNHGPYESSITSPGVSPFCFTVGACTTENNYPKVADFSSRGPVIYKVDKPDIVMPGVSITSLNADILYKPNNNKNLGNNKINTFYGEITGTSVSASQAAAYAALVYQKNPALTPDDIKNTLKICTVSINELKNSQGTGIISIKKLEEI